MKYPEGFKDAIVKGVGKLHPDKTYIVDSAEDVKRLTNVKVELESQPFLVKVSLLFTQCNMYGCTFFT